MTYIYSVGQDVGLSTTVMNDAGAPANAASVVLTVTNPDGTTQTPPTVNTGTGTYTAVVPGLSQPGIYLYRWLAGGSGFAWSSEGQFQCRPQGVEQLVDLASVKAHLNISTIDQDRDDELIGFILAATEIVRDITGPVVPETHIEYFDGGVGTLVVAWQPLMSITQVVEYYGLSTFVLSEQPLGAQMNAFAYTVDYTTGQITRRTFGGQAAMFAIGDKNIKVQYIAGRATIPFAMRLGTLELIRHNWQLTQQSGRSKFRGAGGSFGGDEAHVPTGFAIPDRVVEMLSPTRRPPGIA